MIGRRPTLDDRTTGLGFVAVLALVVLVRVWAPHDQVFRDGAVVLAGNDPYFYRYWIEHLLASNASPLRPRSPASPDALRDHDYFFHRCRARPEARLVSTGISLEPGYKKGPAVGASLHLVCW